MVGDQQLISLYMVGHFVPAYLPNVKGYQPTSPLVMQSNRHMHMSSHCQLATSKQTTLKIDANFFKISGFENDVRNKKDLTIPTATSCRLIK